MNKNVAVIVATGWWEPWTSPNLDSNLVLKEIERPLSCQFCHKII